MARSRRRILGVLLVGAVVALTLAFLLMASPPNGRLQLQGFYDRVRVGMTDGEVSNLIPDSYAADKGGVIIRQEGPVFSLRVKQGAVCEAVYIRYDANSRVSDKQYDRGLMLRARFWFDSLLRKLLW